MKKKSTFSSSSKVDDVDLSLQSRMKEGSHTSVVKSEKKDEMVFQLKLTGGQPQLAESKKDTSLGFMNETEALKRK